jgi:Ca-activated chloride channel family protein
MKLIIVLVLTIFVASASSPSDENLGTITGYLFDGKTNKPLIHANVVIIGTTKGAMSLENGKFVIDKLEPGTYTIKVLMMGYKPIEKKVVVKAGEVLELNFNMERTIVSTSQVINVVGERGMVDVTSSSVRSSVTEYQVKEPGSAVPGAAAGYQIMEMATESVVDAVALKTGIVKTGDELHARGGRTGTIQMGIDGTPVEDPLAGGGKSEGGSKDKPRNTRDKWAGNKGVPPPKELKQEPVKPMPVPAKRVIVNRPPPRKLEPRVTECRPICRRTACGSPHRVCRVSPRWRCGQYPGESYDPIIENAFCCSIDKAVSTFSVDVDAASYANTRRYLRTHALPPRNAVRIEELINYFSYDYPDPTSEHPFSITTEVAGCPWEPEHRLVHVGLQGKRVEMSDAPPNNLVFLIDVSGSMRPANKLPLLRRSFQLLVDHLRPEDRVAIVVYAGAAGLVLDSTPGTHKDDIRDAISHLHAGGSTAGGAGIKLAYQIAEKNYDKDANNRVILATDGDFNVGAASDEAMVELIESKRDAGIFLTVLGFGAGNLKDSKMEKIADKGNGHFAYIDNILEAKKVLINELGATLLTIAKDVKIQIEFNPAKVESYRLIGYENRVLKKEDFDDDTKDAGEIGAGHSVTALYEIVPVVVGPADGRADNLLGNDLKYVDVRLSEAGRESPEILTVKFRYKRPDEDESILLTEVILDDGGAFETASANFRFAAAVAEFGMLLRDSKFRGDASFEHVIDTAREAKGTDKEGYRGEFVQLVEMCDLMVANR